jgi:hypothetical protein
MSEIDVRQSSERNVHRHIQGVDRKYELQNLAELSARKIVYERKYPMFMPTA